MTNAPEQVWIRRGTSRDREQLEKLKEKPSADVIESFAGYTKTTSLTARDAAMVRAGMHEAAKIADTQGQKNLSKEILTLSVDTETLDRIIARVTAQD